MRTSLLVSWASRVVFAGFTAAAVMACAADEQVVVQKDPPKDPPPPPPQTTKEDAAPPPWCADAQGVYAAKPVPGNVLFVVDRSGSMQIKLTNGGTRWTESKKGFFNLLEALPANTRVGAMMFPQGDAPITCCNISPTPQRREVQLRHRGAPRHHPALRRAKKYNVPVPVADISLAQVMDIEAYISSSDKEFYWGTPLAPSLQGAIAQQQALNATGHQVHRAPHRRLPDLVRLDRGSDGERHPARRRRGGARAPRHGIRTFVMGVIDGTKGARADYLSPVAEAGGTSRKQGCTADNSCFYALNEKTFAQDIKGAFDQIALQAFDCTFDLPEVQGNATADLTKINVQLKDAQKNATHHRPRHDAGRRLGLPPGPEAPPAPRQRVRGHQGRQRDERRDRRRLQDAGEVS